MKAAYLGVALLALAAATPVQADDVWHDSVYGCVIGGGVAGTSAAFVIYSAMASGAGTVPATAVVVGNTIFGCGLGTIGVMLYHGVSSTYTSLFGAAPASP
jgi:hypothetical protein